jgi:hypothetical protein
LLVTIVSYFVVIALVLDFASCCTTIGYGDGFYFRHDFKKSEKWLTRYDKAIQLIYYMQAVCGLLAVILMVLTTKRLRNLVKELKID